MIDLAPRVVVAGRRIAAVALSEQPDSAGTLRLAFTDGAELVLVNEADRSRVEFFEAAV